MVCITKQNNNGYTYLYISTSFRIDGKISNSKVRAGKINKRGVCELNPEFKDHEAVKKFIKKCNEEGIRYVFGKEEDVFYSEEDIRNEKVLDVGTGHLMDYASKESGLRETLEAVFGSDVAALYIAIASFLAVKGDPLYVAEDYLVRQDFFNGLAGKLSGQRISDLLSAIDKEKIDLFFSYWMDKVDDDEVLALDITSISTWSELLSVPGRGYNRDGDKLAQINMALLCGIDSYLPIRNEIYEGEICDISTLKNFISLLPAGRKVTIITDKGFSSKENIEFLIENGIHFIMALPFTMDFASSMTRMAEEKGIHDYKYRRTIGKDRLQMMCFENVPFYEGPSVNVFVYCNEDIIHDLKSAQKDKLSVLSRKIEESPQKAAKDSDVLKYFRVRKKYGGKEGELSFTLREDVLNAELAHKGWLVVVSDSFSDEYKVIDYYRRKDVVEKGRDCYKNRIGLNRVRVHDDSRLTPCHFIGFVALVLRMWVHKRMDKGDLYKNYSMKKMFSTIDAQSVHIMPDGKRILSPLSSKERLIYKALEVPFPCSEM